MTTGDDVAITEHSGLTLPMIHCLDLWACPVRRWRGGQMGTRPL